MQHVCTMYKVRDHKIVNISLSTRDMTKIFIRNYISEYGMKEIWKVEIENLSTIACT